MTSGKERQQRAAARAKLAREMAQRQAAAKKRRQVKITAGAAAALLLVVGGAFWAVLALTGGEDEEPFAPAADATPTTDPLTHPGECVWDPVEEDPRTQEVDVGTPPDDVAPEDATQLLTVATNYGDIVTEIDLAAAPCVAASFAHLAEQEVYQDVKCHRAFEGMLQCGDPFVTEADEFAMEDGTGGPTYQYADENLPVGQQPPYPRGTMAMANSGPGTNGSQFFYIYEDAELDGPNYSVVGTVVEGLEVLDEIGAEGNFTDDFGTSRPEAEVVISEVTVSEPEPYDP